MKRRTLINKGLLFVSSLAIGGVFYPLFKFLWPSARKSSVIERGEVSIPLDSISIGGAKLVRFREKPAIIIRTKTDKAIAFSAKCTHLGCIIKWNEEAGELFCPCHEARFDIYGNVLGGPAPRPLPAFAVSIRGDNIYINNI